MEMVGDWVVDLLEVDSQIGVLGNVEHELAVIVGNGLDVVVEHLDDNIFDGIALFVLQCPFNNSLLPIGNVYEQYGEKDG